MSLSQKEYNRKILNSEIGFTIKEWGGRRRIVLIYPNLYRVGMSNLSLHGIYKKINGHDDLLCERAFLPEMEMIAEMARKNEPLLSIESCKPLYEFDIAIFTISFELDFFNIPKILKISKIPIINLHRQDHHPLILAGGFAIFLNPQPLHQFVDVFMVGDLEVLLDSLVETLKNCTGGIRLRQLLIDKLSMMDGCYSPLEDKKIPFRKKAVSVMKSRFDLSQCISNSIFYSNAEFSNMNLIEINRGCRWGCRFCAIGYLYRPYRERNLDLIKDAIRYGKNVRERVGLVGADICGYGKFDDLITFIESEGLKVSVSSLRPDMIDESLIKMLVRHGQRTVTIAPEVGDDDMRFSLNKCIEGEKIIHCAEILARCGIKRVKLYFMIGLYDSEVEDMVKFIIEFSNTSVKSGRMSNPDVIVSVEPFVPKPFTPLRSFPLLPEDELRLRIKKVKKILSRYSKVRFSKISVDESFLESLTSRGDERVSEILKNYTDRPYPSWREIKRHYPELIDQLLDSRRFENQSGIYLNHGISNDYLKEQYILFEKGILSNPCSSECMECGICNDRLRCF